MMPPQQAVLLYIGLGVVSYILWRGLNALSRRFTRLPPGPPGLPLLGNLLQIGSNPPKSLHRLAHKYGPLMCLRLGFKTAVVVSSAAMAEQVLKTHDRDMAGRDPILVSCIFGEDRKCFVFAQPGARWRLLRRISTTHLFSHAKLNSLHPLHLRRSHVRGTLHQLLQKSADSASINVREFVSRASLAVLGAMIFGKDMFHPESQRFAEFKDALCILAERGVQSNFMDFFPPVMQRLGMDPQRIIHDTKLNKLRVYAFLDELFQQRFRRRRNGDDGPTDVLDTVLDIADSQPDFGLYDIKVYLVDMLAAGIDTTMITMEWAMSELIRHPSMMKKVQSEIDEVVGRFRLVEEADIDNLPYLRAVVKETLRLHPAVPLLVPHRAQRRCQIGEFMVPKDAQVIVNFWAIARDPALWKQPSQFMPDRFLNSSLDFRGHDFEFIPFGAGRRMCVGMPLANIMIHSLLAALLQAFSWRLPPGTGTGTGMEPLDLDMTEKFGVTMHKATPLCATATPRLPSHVFS